MRNLIPLTVILIFSFHVSVSQGLLTDDMKDKEQQLIASTKQINQFFRRFNGEENEDGKRYFEGDKRYRDGSLRRKYMPLLFDIESSQIESKPVEAFVKKITNKKTPHFLDFHNDDWFAEVLTEFDFNGEKIYGTLFMKLQQQGLGYEWVIEDVLFNDLARTFDKDTTATKKFMHPMSHELAFMTLRKALADENHTEQFTLRNYTPDILTIFLYEMNQGNLKFLTVKSVSFHFFSIEGYYFSLANFNRPSYNSGWLISDLVPLENDNQKQQIKDYIYGKD